MFKKIDAKIKSFVSSFFVNKIDLYYCSITKKKTFYIFKNE